MSSAEIEEVINRSGLHPLVVIVGPTGVGKSEIAIQLAAQFAGDIVSADSRTFYRGMTIGTAKPSPSDMVLVPHHLIDVANPDETWSLAIFQREANKAIQSIYHRHRLPFLVGGTGQFVRAIIEGWSLPHVPPDPRMREVLTRWVKSLGPDGRYVKLSKLDPLAAQTIDPTNVRRVVRALEVILSSGKRFSEQKRRGGSIYNTLLLGLSCPRDELYRRIDERIDRMIEAGLVDEVQRLLDQGYSTELPTMSAIGYAEMVAYLQGKIGMVEAVRLMKRRSRVFVRRQANWFRLEDPNIHWFKVGPKAGAEMEKLIRHWLTTIQWDHYPPK